MTSSNGQAAEPTAAVAEPSANGGQPADAAPAEAAPAAPVIEILGEATDEQVAALVAVFSAMGGGEPEPEPEGSLWRSPRLAVRRILPHGPGAWRASALPRW